MGSIVSFSSNRSLVLIFCFSLAATFVSENAIAQDEASAKVTYDQVRPVFRKHCVTCHNQERARGDLDLSSVGGIKAGAASGVAAVSGKPEESLIYTLAAHLETPKMPPSSPKIPQRELDLIRRWIEGGMAEKGEAGPAPNPAIAKSAGKPTTVAAAAPTAKAGPKAEDMSAMAKGVQIASLPRPTPITALAASPVSPLVAVSGRKQVVLFRWTDRTPVGALPFPEGDVFALRFSRDGEVLLAGGGVGGLSGKVVGFEVATGRVLFELGDETDVVLAADISPDKSLVALGGPGRSVKVYRTADGELAATLRKHTDWILSLAFSPEGLLLASSDRFGGLQVWESGTGKEFHTLRGHVGAVNALAWTADSERLLSAGQDGTLRLWNMHDGEPVARWDAGVGGILAVDLDAAGRVLCSGRNRKVAVWDKPDTRSRELAMPDEVARVALGHDGSHVIAGDAAGNIAIFGLDDGALAGNFTIPLAPTSPAAAVVRAPPRKASGPAAVERTAPIGSELAAAEVQAKQTAAELTQVREALTLAEAAVNSADESLARLREAASRLAGVVAARELAAKQAAERLAELRAQADRGRPDLRAEKERMLRQLDEKRSLLESTVAVAERIARAAAQAPDDTGLAVAAKLAGELRGNLARDVETTTAELRRLETSSTTAQK